MNIHVLKSISDNKLAISAMVERNIKGRYRSSIMGILWNIIMPALLVFAVWLVFTQVKTFHTEKNFWIYLSVGMFALTTCSTCIRGRAFYNNASYIKKIAIPRWVEPLADVLAQFVTLIISYVVIVVVAIIIGHNLDITFIVFLPIILILLFILCFGLSLFFSTLSVVNSDVGHFMIVVSRILVWLTPVFFFMNEAKDILKTVALCNPFTYYVEVIHQIIYWGTIPDMMYLGLCALISFIALAFGWIVFSHYEKNLAEML